MTIDIVSTFKPGDPPPLGYIDWHEWARVQHRAGYRQHKCGKCGLYRFPQEFDGSDCKDCAKKAAVDHSNTANVR